MGQNGICKSEKRREFVYEIIIIILLYCHCHPRIFSGAIAEEKISGIQFISSYKNYKRNYCLLILTGFQINFSSACWRIRNFLE